MSKNKTALQSALADIEGYKNFSKVIDIDFVIALFENVYLELETKQLLDGFVKGTEQKYVTPEHFFVSNYEQYVNRRMRENGEKTVGDKFWQMKVDSFDFSVRTYNILRKMKVETFGDLINVSEKMLYAQKDCGVKTVQEIKETLKSYNFELKK